jgi:hypothetical protein
MKTIISFILVIWAILLVGLPFVQKSEAAMSKAIDLGKINAEGQLDRCLLAIATDPNLLKKIDQRNIFNRDDVYHDVLRKTLDNASKFIPYDINNPANLNDANKPTNLMVSLCLADSRVYFWRSLDDRNVIGWISIQGIQEWRTNKEPTLTVWIVPQLNKTTSFTENWRELAKQKNITSKKALMKLALDIDVADANSDGEQLRGRIKVKTYENHSVRLFMSGNIFQTEIMLLSDESIGKPGKPGILGPIQEGEGVLKNLPISLPFWPPKEDKMKPD